jgi:hypothetical protein
MVAVDPFLLLLFVPKAVPGWRAAWLVHRLYQEQGEEGMEQQGGGGACPFKSVFWVLFPFLFPSSSLHQHKWWGC